MDLNDLVRDGRVSLDAFLDFAENETPIVTASTEAALGSRGIELMTEAVGIHLRDKAHAAELLEALFKTIVELGFAARTRASEFDGLMFSLQSRAPGGAKDSFKDFLRAVKRETRRQREAIRARAPQAKRNEDAPDPVVWDRLQKSPEGAPVGSFSNLCLVLEQDPKWKNRLRFDEFRQRSLISKPPFEPQATERTIDDNDVSWIRRWLEEVYGLRGGAIDVGTATELVARRRRFHPVREYLQGLTWDGKPRLAELFGRYFGAVPDTDEEKRLYQAYSTLWGVGAVRRMMEAPTKVDTLPVLVGGQGLKKSSGLRLLVGSAFFRDSHFDIRSKDAFQLLNGAFVYEIADFAPLSMRDHSLVRAFITSETDSYRPPYGKHAIDVPRQSVFIATANPTPGRGLLTDPTGHRRYWVIQITQEVDLEGIAADRDQLWAEAMHLYAKGAQHWLPNELESARKANNDRFQDEDPLVDTMRTVLRQRLAETWEEVQMTTTSLLGEACGIPPERCRGAIVRDAAALLKAEGWQRVFRRRAGWVYVPPSADATEGGG